MSAVVTLRWKSAHGSLSPGRSWRRPLTFEHEAAAVARLAGFADEIKVLSPDSIRERLVATARAIIAKYAGTDEMASTSVDIH